MWVPKQFSTATAAAAADDYDEFPNAYLFRARRFSLSLSNGSFIFVIIKHSVCGMCYGLVWWGEN